jgi:hypothetical protein
VHHRVLETALRTNPDASPSDLFSQPVNFMAATHAKIAVGKPQGVPFHQIDFYLYVDPERATTIRGREAIKQTRQDLLVHDHFSVNHTEYGPLRSKPHHRQHHHRQHRV